ncbi:MAG: putative ABC transport system permease protein [Saprospiraceae bacterium]|jgi:putative ABC transport system permease protein
MNHWLQNFHYRIEMPWWSYGIAGILAITVALGTIGFQSLKAARMNPVDSLRNE